MSKKPSKASSPGADRERESEGPAPKRRTDLPQEPSEDGPSRSFLVWLFHGAVLVVFPLATFWVSPSSLESFRTPQQALFMFGVFVALPLFLAARIYSRPRIAVRIPSVWPPVVCLLLIAAASIFLSPLKAVAFREFVFFLESVLFAFFLLQIVRSRTQVWVALGAVTVVAAGIAAGAAGQYFFNLNERFNLGKEFYDPFSFLGNKNYVCEFLAMVIPMTVALALAARRAAVRVLYFALSFFFFVVALITQTRGGWLGLAAALLTMGVFLLARRRRLFVQLAAVGAVAALVLAQVAFLQSRGILFDRSAIPFMKRITSIVDRNEASIRARKIIWNSSWLMFEDNPFGVGIGAYKTEYLSYLKKYVRQTGLKRLPTPFKDVNAKEAHNEYFHLLVEMGAPGLLAMIWLIVRIAFLYRGVAARLEDPFDWALATGAFCSLVSVGVSAVFGFPFHIVPTAMCAGAFLAILLHCEMSAGAGGAEVRSPFGSGPASGGMEVFALFAGFAVMTYGAFYSLGPWRGGILVKAANQCLTVAGDISAKGTPVRMRSANVCVPADQLDDFHREDSAHQAERILDNAQRLFERALKLDDASGEGHTFYGGFLLNRKDYKGAERELLSAQKHHNLPFIHLNLAKLYFESGQKQKAKHEFEETLLLMPEEHSSSYNLGVLHFEEGNLAKAVEYLRRAIDSAGPEVRSEYYFRLAVCHQKEGRTAEAEKVYSELLAKFPNDVDALYNLGLIFSTDLKDWARAKEMYARALEVDPGHCPSLNNMGNILMEEGKVDEAARKYKACLEANPNYQDAKSNLAAALYRSGKHREAVAAAAGVENQAAPASNRFKTRIVKGMALRDSGDVDGALASFKEALALWPESGLAQLHRVQAAVELARAHFMKDNWGACFESLKPIMKEVDLTAGDITGRGLEQEARRFFGSCAFNARQFDVAAYELGLNCSKFGAECNWAEEAKKRASGETPP